MSKIIKDNFKTVIIFIITAALGYVLWQWIQTSIDNRDMRISTLETAIIDKDKIIEERNEELNKLKQSDKITDKSVGDIRTEIENANKSNSAAFAEMQRQLSAIDNKYDALPKTPVNEERKSSEISIVRSKGLWATFCIQEPTNHNCKDK